MTLRTRILFSFTGLTAVILLTVSILVNQAATTLTHDSLDKYRALKTELAGTVAERELAFRLEQVRLNGMPGAESEQAGIPIFQVFSPEKALPVGSDGWLFDSVSGKWLYPFYPQKDGPGASFLAFNPENLIRFCEPFLTDTSLKLQILGPGNLVLGARDTLFSRFLGRDLQTPDSSQVDFGAYIHHTRGRVQNLDDWNDRSLFIFPLDGTPFRILVSVSSSEETETAENLFYLIALINLVLFLLLTLSGFYVIRIVTGPVKAATLFIRDITTGRSKLSDLSSTGKDEEFKLLDQSVSDLYLSLSSSVDLIKKNGIELSMMTEEIRTNLNTFSESAVSLSAAVTQTTSAMEEMTASSRNISSTSSEVVLIAKNSQSRALDGLDGFRQFVKKMEDIRQKNELRSQDIGTLAKKAARITEIMTIINHINEQTKLIAFNAALEASGAGEAGKRFSVVANEIRRLADNVQESTEEIKLMISEIQHSAVELMKGTSEASGSIQSGIVHINGMVGTMETFVNEASNTTEAAQQISYSTQQQLSAAEEIVTTLHDVSVTATRFAEISNSLARTAERLNAMSVQLVEMTIVNVQ
ncbi:MAG: methyl-accepting chemotaxis protein [Bacteroidetes bacterium]|nr:methyl-accepting chemotaxis protein [Bacteroidota bacterium]